MVLLCSSDCILEFLDTCLCSSFVCSITDILMQYFITLVLHPWYSFFYCVESIDDAFPFCLFDLLAFLFLKFLCVFFCLSQNQIFLSESFSHVAYFFIYSVNFWLHVADFLSPGSGLISFACSPPLSGHWSFFSRKFLKPSPGIFSWVQQLWNCDLLEV